jgi:hypothetical protein
MALNFPDSPTLNQVYTDTTAGFQYQWDGTVWRSYAPAAASQIQVLDDISGSFNGSTQSFALTLETVAYDPANAQQLRVVLGGIVQEPGVDYTVSGSSITFTTPPSALLDCSIVSSGPAVPINTILDGSITPAKLSIGGPSWNSSGDLTVTGNVSVGGTITYEDVTNVDSIGLGTFRNGLIVNTGTATTALIVNGDARVTGILTIGTSSITLNGTNNVINVGTGITFNGNGGSVAVSGIITAASFVGDGSGLTGAGSTVANDTATNSTFYPLFTTITSGTVTATKVSTTKLTFNPSTGTLSATDLNSSSDSTLKENVETVEDALNKVNNLHGVKFNWKEDGRPSYGVIAQELEQVLPELVTNTDPKSVNYNGIIAVLIEAVKELTQRVEELENKS